MRNTPSNHDSYSIYANQCHFYQSGVHVTEVVYMRCHFSKSGVYAIYHLHRHRAMATTSVYNYIYTYTYKHIFIIIKTYTLIMACAL